MENVHIINNEVMVNTKPNRGSVMKNTTAMVAFIFCSTVILSHLSGCGVEDRSWKNNESNGGSDAQGDATSQTQDSGSGQDAGSGQNSGDGQGSQQSAEEITYEIPDGWRWTDLRKRDAIRGESAPADFKVSQVKIELLGVSEGDAASAESSVKKMYETYKTDCLNQGTDCAASPEYLALDIAGIKVHCAMSASKSFSADTGWNTYIEFAKNGHKAGFMLYDRADRQKDLLEKVSSTITWE